MPLYNNILLSRKTDSKGNDQTSKLSSSTSSNASMKFLQDHLLSKRRSQQTLTPKAANKQQGSQDTKVSGQIISETTLHKQHENSWDPEDEYDPMVPNSYEVLQDEWIKSEDLRFASIKLAPIKTVNSNYLEVLDKLDDEDDDSAPSNKQTRGTAIAPPPSLAKSSVSFYENVDQVKPGPQLPTVPASSSSEKLDGSSIAAKIMSKMGYKAGQGLGKDEQGISSPLEVEKSGSNVGRIVGFTTTTSSSETQSKAAVIGSTKLETKKEASTTKSEDNMAELLRESTRVLLLQNMVGPGEVDDDLEAETKEECKKYGEVIKCLIYEIPNKRVADDEAVRIFVEFRTAESAIRAVSDLNGRYFGGRVVRASFYSVERFNKYKLGPI